jgi:hypothetical protein
MEIVAGAPLPVAIACSTSARITNQLDHLALLLSSDFSSSFSYSSLFSLLVTVLDTFSACR